MSPFSLWLLVADAKSHVGSVHPGLGLRQCRASYSSFNLWTCRKAFFSRVPGWTLGTGHWVRSAASCSLDLAKFLCCCLDGGEIWTRQISLKSPPPTLSASWWSHWVSAAGGMQAGTCPLYPTQCQLRHSVQGNRRGRRNHLKNCQSLHPTDKTFRNFLAPPT